jgi:hypothetical protein
MSRTTRRAVLGALAAAPALALPAAAMAGSADSQDAELFRLIDAARAATARYDAASEALEQAYDRTEEVPPPQALIATEYDAQLFDGLLEVGKPALSYVDFAKRKRELRLKAVDAVVARVSSLVVSGPAAHDDRMAAARQCKAEIDARESKFIAAADQWREMRRLAEDRSGKTAAEELSDRLFTEKYDACQAVALTRARTLAGMLAKLAFIAGDFHDDEKIPADWGTSEHILFSVAVDYKTIGEART